MGAHFFCWTPELELSPFDADFEESVVALHAQPRPEPAAAAENFIRDLVSRFTELDDMLWATGPLEVDIRGNFVDLDLNVDRYAEAQPLLVETARAHGLNCYDLQDGNLYPAKLN